MPVIVNDRVLHSGDRRQVQFLDTVETPVVFNDRCLVSGCRKLRILRSCSSLTRCGRPCDYAVTCLAVGGATDSVHRLIWWTSQFAQRHVAVGYVAAMRDQGQDFLGHPCQSQVPVVPESPGVSLPGDSAPGLPISS